MLMDNAQGTALQGRGQQGAAHYWRRQRLARQRQRGVQPVRPTQPASINGVGNGNDCTSTANSFAIGIGDNTNNATQIGGNDNFVSAVAGDDKTGPGLSHAFNIGGSKNFVIASIGPRPIAGAIGVSNYNGTSLPMIVKKGTGTNIKTPLNP